MLHIAWKTYTRYDVYGKCDCVVIARENYMHGIMYLGDERVSSWLLSLLVIGMYITSSTAMRLNKVCCHLTCVDGKSRPRT